MDFRLCAMSCYVMPPAPGSLYRIPRFFDKVNSFFPFSGFFLFGQFPVISAHFYRCLDSSHVLYGSIAAGSIGLPRSRTAQQYNKEFPARPARIDLAMCHKFVPTIWIISPNDGHFICAPAPSGRLPRRSFSPAYFRKPMANSTNFCHKIFPLSAAGLCPEPIRTSLRFSRKGVLIL